MAVGKIRGKLSKGTEGRVGGRDRAVISDDNEKRPSSCESPKPILPPLNALIYIYIYKDSGTMVGQPRVSITIIGQ